MEYSFYDFLKLLGSLALFLYGMKIMSEGLQKFAGDRLRTILTAMTTNRVTGVLTGILITALIQSSSATTVMVVSFVNAGLLTLGQSIGVIMGANVGTTVTAWLISVFGFKVDIAAFALPLLAIGVPLLFSQKSSRKSIGEFIFGFSFLFMGLSYLQVYSPDLGKNPEMLAFVQEWTDLGFLSIIIFVLVGAVITMIVQASAATMAITLIMCANGWISFELGAALAMGQNIGTCVTAMISSVGASKGAKRTAFVHLYFNIIGTIIFMLVFYLGNAFFHFSFTNETVGVAGIAAIHTVFNIFATLVLLPFTKGLEKLAYLTIPVSPEEKEVQDDVFTILDDRFLSSPAFAIEQCHSLVNQMAEMTKAGFMEAMTVLTDYSEEKIADVIAKENRVDTYDDKISAYLTKLSSQDLSYKDSLKVTSLLHCLTDFERISDHSINVVENAQQMNKDGASFSKKAKEEMRIYGEAIADILNRTTKAFVEGDDDLARTVEPLEEVIDEINKDVKKNHMKRLRKGKCTIELGLVLSDLAMNYERVADHCSNIAVYMMQLYDTELEEHSFTEQMDAGESAEFAKQLAEFKKMYEL